MFSRYIKNCFVLLLRPISRKKAIFDISCPYAGKRLNVKAVRWCFPPFYPRFGSFGLQQQAPCRSWIPELERSRRRRERWVKEEKPPRPPPSRPSRGTTVTAATTTATAARPRQVPQKKKKKKTPCQTSKSSRVRGANLFPSSCSPTTCVINERLQGHFLFPFFTIPLFLSPLAIKGRRTRT